MQRGKVRHRWVFVAVLLGVLIVAGVGWRWWTQPASQEAAEPPDTAASEPPTDKPSVAGLPDDPSKQSAPVVMQLPAVTDVAVADAPPVSGPAQAQQVLDEQAKALGLGEGARLQVASHSADDAGNAYYHSQQYYHGLPVLGAMVNLEVQQGRAEQVSGTWVRDIRVAPEPTLTAQQALQQGLLARGVPAERTATILGDAQLAIYMTGQGARLVWQVSAHLTQPNTLPQRYLVDAHAAQILSQQPVFEP